MGIWRDLKSLLLLPPYLYHPSKKSTFESEICGINNYYMINYKIHKNCSSQTEMYGQCTNSVRINKQSLAWHTVSLKIWSLKIWSLFTSSLYCVHSLIYHMYSIYKNNLNAVSQVSNFPALNYTN